MTLLVAMLPVYLFGNLHCIGMCGASRDDDRSSPLRYFYFLGRFLSFTLAAPLAGAAGAVLQIVLTHYHIPALTSFLFGSIILLTSTFTLLGWHYPFHHILAKRLSKINHTLSLLMLRDQPLPAFLFSFFNMLLPCGQTLLVFSSCALAGDALVGFGNGAVFALLTTPSLAFAMNARLVLQYFKRHYNTLIGVPAFLLELLRFAGGPQRWN